MDAAGIEVLSWNDFEVPYCNASRTSTSPGASMYLCHGSLTALTNFLMITSSSSMKDDFPFTVGFYYAEDPHTALSFPYPDAELRFHFDSSPDVRIKSPISKKEYKHVKDLVKILPAGVEPGTYDLKWYSGSKVVHKANYTINFVGCNGKDRGNFMFTLQNVTPCQEKITDGRKIEPAEGVCVRTSKGKQGAISLYTCFEISQPRKDVTLKPTVQCMQKAIYIPPTLPSDAPGIQITHIGNKVVVTPIGKQPAVPVTGTK
uniref:Uncharacterized protein n=1 Tax=Romanomermis culicivorax TaxID=13658 RepID=A0A915L8A3_ROMCU